MNTFEKELEEIFFVTPSESENHITKMEHSIVRFISFAHRTAAEIHKFTDMLCIELSLTPKVFQLSDFEAHTENL